MCLFIGIPAFLQSEFSLTPAGTKNPGHVSIELFNTSDVLFIRSLLARLERESLIPPEDFLQFFERERRRIVSIHIRMSQSSSGRFASAMYQDGVLHALGDVLTSTALGSKKKEHFENDLRDTQHNLEGVRRQDNPIEIAYWSDRYEIIKGFGKYDKKSIPAYFHPDRLRPVRKLVPGEKFEPFP